MPLITVCDCDERCRSSDLKSSPCPLVSLLGYNCIHWSQASGSPAQTAGSGRSGPGPHGVRSGRGRFRAGEIGCRRRSEAASSRWLRRCSRRRALVTATSASTGAIMSAVASSVRCSTVGRRAGAGACDQVTVTDSHHPALRIAPAASARRQCPRDSCTCCRQSPWLSRGREREEASSMHTLCARPCPRSPPSWSGGDRRMSRCVATQPDRLGGHRPAGPG